MVESRYCKPVFSPGIFHAVAVSFLTQDAAHITFQQSAQAAEAVVILAVLTAAAPLGFSVVPEDSIV